MVKALVDWPERVSFYFVEVHETIRCTIVVDQNDVSRFIGDRGSKTAGAISLVALRMSDPAMPVIVRFPSAK